jgi:hypothetical protein
MNRSFVQHSDSSELVHAMSVGGREAPVRMEPLPTTQTVALRSTRSLRNWALWVLAPILQRRREFLTADGTDFTDEGEDETVAIGVLLPWLKLSAGQCAPDSFLCLCSVPSVRDLLQARLASDSFRIDLWIGRTNTVSRYCICPAPRR